MAKKVYTESIKKWAIGIGISGGTLVGLIFLYLALAGAISVPSVYIESVCEGTVENPCLAFINFTANEDVFIYPVDYDPWGRNTSFEFDTAVKNWTLQRSWGASWRTIPLDKSCTGTWCGLSNAKDKRKFSIVFREGRDYQLRIVALKYNPWDTIKWSALNGIINLSWNASLNRDVFEEEIYPVCTTSEKYEITMLEYVLPMEGNDSLNVTYNNRTIVNKTVQECQELVRPSIFINESGENSLFSCNIEQWLTCTKTSSGFVCDSKHYGNGDGICQGSEDCVNISVKNGQVFMNEPISRRLRRVMDVGCFEQ